MEEKKFVNVSKSVSYPSDWWDRFAEAAKKERLSVTAWVGMACRNFLPDDVACQLSPKSKAGRKPLTKEQKTICRGCLVKPREDGEAYCRKCFRSSDKYKKLLAGYIKAVNDSQKLNQGGA